MRAGHELPTTPRTISPPCSGRHHGRRIQRRLGNRQPERESLWCNCHSRQEFSKDCREAGKMGKVGEGKRAGTVQERKERAINKVVLRH